MIKILRTRMNKEAVGRGVWEGKEDESRSERSQGVL
jgi:hypothetical protein